MTARQVAESVGTTAAQVRKWKSADKWQAVLEAQKPPRKRGGQPGNKNAAGAGAPAGNRNAETHGAYTTVRLDDLQPEQRAYIEGLTLDTERNMLEELRQLLAKEIDLQNKIAALETSEPDSLYIDRVVEMRTPKGQERLKQQREKLEALQREEDSLLWDMDGGEGGKRLHDSRKRSLNAYNGRLRPYRTQRATERGNWKRAHITSQCRRS